MAVTRRSPQREPGSEKQAFLRNASGKCVTSATPSSSVNGDRPSAMIVFTASSGRTLSVALPVSIPAAMYESRRHLNLRGRREARQIVILNHRKARAGWQLHACHRLARGDEGVRDDYHERQLPAGRGRQRGCLLCQRFEVPPECLRRQARGSG